MKDLSNENIIHKSKNGIQFIQFKKLLEYSDIINHAYSIGTEVDYRTIGANQTLLPENEYLNKIKNYKNLCNCINIDYKNLVKPTQAHTNNVKAIENKVLKDNLDFNQPQYANLDGLVTNKKNIALSTTNADCILLLFFDPVKRVISNVHSGWRGTFQKICKTSVELMISKYECNPKDIICCMCPSIRKCHFEVGYDVYKECINIFGDLCKNNNIIEQISENKWKIDTILINKIILQNLGLMPENIIDSGICSVCESNLIHSFRVEKEGYGLETAIIQLI